MSGYSKFLLGATRALMALFLFIMTLLAIAVVLDRTFRLGWGYEWSDLLVLICITLGGAALYFLAMRFYKLIGFGGS